MSQSGCCKPYCSACINRCICRMHADTCFLCLLLCVCTCFDYTRSYMGCALYSARVCLHTRAPPPSCVVPSWATVVHLETGEHTHVILFLTLGDPTAHN